jgi:hypothetical protein
MKIKILFAFFFASMISGFHSFSQPYKNAFGLRFSKSTWLFRTDYYGGLTYRHFLSEQRSLEAILSARYRGADLIGLYEFHNSTSEENLSWYWGLGGHVGLSKEDFYNPFSETPVLVGTVTPSLGADAIIGLEYAFKKTPLCVSADVKPSFDIIRYDLDLFDIGVSLRYCF